MQSLRRPEILLYLMAAAVPIAFGVWQALLNNFTIEAANFTGVEIGILQSLREIPGFLAFAVVFLLLILREQTLALLSLLIMGLGTALTGYFPTEIGLYCTTVLMSLGFHYYETVNQSLSLQIFAKQEAAHKMGKMVAVGSAASLVAFSAVWFFIEIMHLEMKTIYVIGGVITMMIACFCWFFFPQFTGKVEQNKKIKLHKRYWLYYALVFMGGARRQIFVVFSGFLMVEKFGFSVSEIALMFLANGLLNIFFAPKIGKLIGKWGEKRTLTIEYVGLILVFSAYAFVTSPAIAVFLYIVDHLLFSMAIAQKTYFQKIADPKDIAQTAGVAFSINHCAAIVLPALYGLLWLSSPALVFLTGAAMAGISLVLARMVPRQPRPGLEVQWRVKAADANAAKMTDNL
ncbi:MAG: MFS transporter [Pseudomonadales bacterium]|nr:MFS transporter [Pseudomonadales bacterium]NRA17012.1 MFS transporter [Oceanospirillaceae bacterium]